jgi:hypothetical protein
MALQDFWSSVRTAARLLAPTATVDSPKLDAGRIEQTLRATDLWLTPRSVAGYHEADWNFLPEPQRQRLTRLVEEFRHVASEIDPTGPAPKESVEQAFPLFRDIIALLEFDRFGDAEALRLGKQIENLIQRHRPAELAELRFQTGPDNTGDPAIWIWAILTDEATPDEERFFQTSERVRKLLDTAARTVAPERWPYIHSRTVAEQSEIMEEAQAG